MTSSGSLAGGGLLATLRAGVTDGMIGRDAELAAADEFLAGLSTGPGVLLLEGEAGAGKTTLWNAAVAAATRRGFRVLSCRPAATEAKLSFGGLDDLLDGVVGEVSDSLPEPQRQALDAVLLRGPSTDADARTVCRAALEIVRLLAGSGPVVLAVDDVQWLDRPSAQVVEYVVRRLGDEPVGVMLAWRSAAAEALPLGLARVPWPERVRRLTVGPLSVGALHRLLQSHLELSLSRPILVRVHATSGGNPFYALEIARAVAATNRRLAADEPLPIPATLTELVRSRLTRLPAATRDVLLVVSALAVPTMRLVAAAVGDSRAGAAVERAARVGVLVAERDRLEFSHPLLASGVYADASRRRRIAVHRRLAEVVADEEERAHHLGLAAEDPDEAVAAALESAASLALKRGAPSTAAEFYERAGRLTPPADGDGVRRRLLVAARCHGVAGNTPRGRQLLEQVLSTDMPGPGRAEALLLLSSGEFGDLASEAVDMLEQALEEAAGRPELEARLLVELVSVHLGGWDIPAAAAHARVALAAAEQAGDLATLSRALVAAGRLEVFQGRPLGIELVQRAESMQPMVEHARIAALPSGWIGTLLRYMDDFDGARTRLEPLLSRAGELGDDSSTGELLYELSELECWAGNWERALAYAQRSVEIQTQAERKWDLTNALAALGVRGGPPRARRGLVRPRHPGTGHRPVDERPRRNGQERACAGIPRAVPVPTGAGPRATRANCQDRRRRPRPRCAPVCGRPHRSAHRRRRPRRRRRASGTVGTPKPRSGPGLGACRCRTLPRAAAQRPRRSHRRPSGDRRGASAPPAGADALRTRPNPARRREDPAASTAAP